MMFGRISTRPCRCRPALHAAAPRAAVDPNHPARCRLRRSAPADRLGPRWDARAAMIDTSPLRPRRIFARATARTRRASRPSSSRRRDPDRRVRAGASDEDRLAEVRRDSVITADRDAKIVTLESEVSSATRTGPDGFAIRSRRTGHETAPAGGCRRSRPWRRAGSRPAGSSACGAAGDADVSDAWTNGCPASKRHSASGSPGADAPGEPPRPPRLCSI